MVSLSALRSTPHFAPLFAHVHPFFWPVLWRSLNRLLRWYATAGYENILFATTRWGRAEIAYLGDRKPDPAAHKAFTPERPRSDESVWASDLSAWLQAETVFPQAAGTVSAQMAEAAFAPILDSS